MTPRSCPRCHSYDIHRSRMKTRTEQLVLSLFGRQPKRCSACGWRGYRGASPPAASESTKGLAKPPELAPRDPYRKHRRKTKRSSLAKSLQTVALAILLGLSVGGGMYSCGGSRGVVASQ